MALLLLVAACSSDDATTEVPAGCTPGTESCACDSGQCGLAGDGSPLTCKEKTCQKAAGCTPGALYCACGDGCAAPATCREGLCLPANGLVVTVGNETVRSCDLLLEAADRSIDQVLLAPGTLGVPISEGKRTAVSFGQQGDSAFSGAALTIVLVGDDAATASAVKATSVACFDRAGLPVASHGLAVK